MEFPLAFGLQKVGLPLICTTDNFIFLIDTGAVFNIINNFVYEKFKDRFRPIGESNKIMGIEGRYVDTPIVEATFNFEGTNFTSRFSVLNMTDAVKSIMDECGVQIHGTLGIEFLVKNNWIINFETLMVESKD